MMRFEFVCAAHPAETLEGWVWAEGNPVSIAVKPCPQCAAERNSSWKDREGEIKDKAAKLEMDAANLSKLLVGGK